jgi:hypothetical protein
MKEINRLPNMEAVIVDHQEMKLIGIPCIGLQDMSKKYHSAKESLLLSTPYFPNVINHRIHYGMWPQVETQKIPARHAYILCVEVSDFAGIPDWYVKLTIPSQRCVVAANDSGDFDAAGKVIESYVKDNGLTVSREGYAYTICERYNYDGEGFSRYSLPIVG